jgi:hypothetical protein
MTEVTSDPAAIRKFAKAAGHLIYDHMILQCYSASLLR